MKKIISCCILFCCIANGMNCMREKRYQLVGGDYTADDLSRADQISDSIKRGRNIQEIIADTAALNVLIKCQKEESVRKLFKEYGVRPTFEALAQAITVGNMPLTLQCLEQNPDLLHQENRIGSVLHLASYANRISLAQKFLEMGLDVNSGNMYHDTPLHIAAKFGYKDMVTLLCDAGANPFIKNIRRHNRSFDAMDVAYRNMMKVHKSRESSGYYYNGDVYKAVLHILYRYVGRFGGAVW